MEYIPHRFSFDVEYFPSFPRFPSLFIGTVVWNKFDSLKQITQHGLAIGRDGLYIIDDGLAASHPLSDKKACFVPW